VKDLRPEDFFEEYIIKRLNAKLVSVGFNFNFGSRRLGNIDTLQKLCDKNDIELRVLPPVLIDGEVISSTGLKNLMNSE
jgi:riboflavin kinase/FMN adenylyltransferase